MRSFLAEELAEQVRAAGLALTIEADLDALPASPVAMCNLQDLCRAIPQVLEGLASDPLGREALQPVRALRVSHQGGARIHASQSQGELSLSLDLEAMLPGGLAAVLESEFNSTL